MKSYKDILKYIIQECDINKPARPGMPSTYSVFGVQFEHELSEGYPLLTSKFVPNSSVLTELEWFTKGLTDVKWLRDRKCNIWNGDGCRVHNSITDSKLNVKEYEYMMDNDIDGTITDLGPVYGHQWRSGVDQLASSIWKLINTPDDRRNIVNSWNVSDIESMGLPPCHYSFQFYTKELTLEARRSLVSDTFDRMLLDDAALDELNVPRREVSLLWNQRSVDTFLGLPFNIASYSALLLWIAKFVNMSPGKIVGHLGNVHVYENHLDQVKEQLSRKTYALPTLDVTRDFSDIDLISLSKDDIGKVLDTFSRHDFVLNDYNHSGTIKGKLSVGV